MKGQGMGFLALWEIGGETFIHHHLSVLMTSWGKEAHGFLLPWKGTALL